METISACCLAISAILIASFIGSGINGNPYGGFPEEQAPPEESLLLSEVELMETCSDRISPT